VKNVTPLEAGDKGGVLAESTKPLPSSVLALSARIGKWMQSAKRMYDEEGFSGVLHLCEIVIMMTLSRWCNRGFASLARFTFEGRKYRYFYHWYNATYWNERAVEVPIVWEIVKSYGGKRILEVGNVLSHYYAVEHTIVDKYEVSPRVINEDVVSFRPEGVKYDLVICISTLEHVGLGGEFREAMKPLCAVENLRQLLASGGIIVVTIPIGQNPALDALLRENRLPFIRCLCLKRISRDNRWQQVEWNQVRNARYNAPYPFANGLVIAFIAAAPLTPSQEESGLRGDLAIRPSQDYEEVFFNTNPSET
jgi:SAM-dependent methyltransferase